MRKSHGGPLILLALWGTLGLTAGQRVQCEKATEDIYQFSLRDVHQEKVVSLQKYRDNVVLIVNVATF